MRDQAERSGQDTADLLSKAAEQWELDSADSISEVLVWRLNHLSRTTPPTRRPRPTHPVPVPSALPPQQAVQGPRPRR